MLHKPLKALAHVACLLINIGSQLVLQHPQNAQKKKKKLFVTGYSLLPYKFVDFFTVIIIFTD